MILAPFIGGPLVFFRRKANLQPVSHTQLVLAVFNLPLAYARDRERVTGHPYKISTAALCHEITTCKLTAYISLKWPILQAFYLP